MARTLQGRGPFNDPTKSEFCLMSHCARWEILEVHTCLLSDHPNCMGLEQCLPPWCLIFFLRMIDIRRTAATSYRSMQAIYMWLEVYLAWLLDHFCQIRIWARCTQCLFRGVVSGSKTCL